MSTQSIIRLDEVKRRTGRSRSSIYADIKKGGFPPPIKLGQHSVGWLESEIAAWVEQRISASRSALTTHTTAGGEHAI